MVTIKKMLPVAFRPKRKTQKTILKTHEICNHHLVVIIVFPKSPKYSSNSIIDYENSYPWSTQHFQIFSKILSHFDNECLLFGRQSGKQKMRLKIFIIASFLVSSDISSDNTILKNKIPIFLTSLIS